MELNLTPADDLIDVARLIRVTDLDAGAHVTITARSTRAGGAVWQAQARFVADATGVVDLSRDALVSGSYSGVSQMGLIWAQEKIAPASGPVDGPASVAPVVTEITAEDSRGARAAARMVQHFHTPGVTRREIQQDGVSGVLYTPDTPGPHPVVVVMNGSGGGVNEPRAALYAARGYAALALGYFRYAGRPYYINDLPMEYFRDALVWVRDTLAPKDGFVAITGQSRGGELVLQIAAMFPELVSAVMAYVPASCRHSAQSAGDPALGRLAPTWTWQGKSMPHLWDNNRTGTYVPYDNGPEPKRLEFTTLTAMADQAAYARARIEVENITAPVLLIHGTDDGWWPTDYHCDLVEETMTAAGRHVERLRYIDAGHQIVFPYIPTTDIVIPHPVSGILSTNGGTPTANAAANEHVWPAVLDFLSRAQQA